MAAQVSISNWFKVFLVILAVAGLVSAWAVPRKIESARAENYQAVLAERAATWGAYARATDNLNDANLVSFLAARAAKCSPPIGASTLEETRKQFIESEARCLRELRTEQAARLDETGYNRTVVLVDWILSTTTPVAKGA